MGWYVTSAPGSDWCPNKSRLETAPSWDLCRGAVTAICGLCSCRRLGSSSSGSRTGTGTVSKPGSTRQEEIAPQCPGDRACQQACPHCVGGSQQGARIRMREDARHCIPTYMSVAPCSEPSRSSPAGGRQSGQC